MEEGQSLYYENELNIFEEKVNKLCEIWKNENIIFQKTLEIKDNSELKTFILNNNNYFHVEEAEVDRYIEKDLNELIKVVEQNYKNFTKFKEIIKDFKEIAKKENLIITKSPYSDSFYAHKEEEEISFGFKPNGSYRISDHWNWDKGDHCPTDTNENFGVALAIFINGKYTQIK